MHCYKCANTGLPLSFIWIQTEVFILFICAQEHLHTKFAVHENPVISRGKKVCILLTLLSVEIYTKTLNDKNTPIVRLQTK